MPSLTAMELIVNIEEQIKIGQFVHRFAPDN